MDKHMIERDEYTGINEINKILRFLCINNYEYNREYSNKVDFEKKISFTNTDGDWINERKLKITIEYENDIKLEKNKNDFIRKLFERKKEIIFSESFFRK